MIVQKKLSKEEYKEWKKRKEARWNTYNLIPNIEEGYNEYEAIEYYYKMLCYQASNGVPSEINRLYSQSSLVEVYELLMLSRAYNW